MSFNHRLFFTIIVSIAIWSLLAWYYFHGGVPAHHLLARADLPKISNWWGGLVLPLLTWWLLYRVDRRIMRDSHGKSSEPQLRTSAVYGFMGGLLFGILLSAFFSWGHSDLPVYLLYALFVVALFFPVYRAECFLGFVLGMTYTFGAVLPTLIGSVLLLIGLVLFNIIRPGTWWVLSSLVRLVRPVNR